MVSPSLNTLLGMIDEDPEGIDWDNLQEKFEAAVEEGVEEWAEEIEWSWRAKAASTLTQSRESYLKAISVERVGATEIVSTLTSGDSQKWNLPRAIEFGSDSYDLKKGFLQGRQYRVIPMGYPTINRFRTVSQFSSGWQHPGFEPRGLLEEVQEEMEGGKIDEIFGRTMGRIKI